MAGETKESSLVLVAGSETPAFPPEQPEFWICAKKEALNALQVLDKNTKDLFTLTFPQVAAATDLGKRHELNDFAESDLMNLTLAGTCKLWFWFCWFSRSEILLQLAKENGDIYHLEVIHQVISRLLASFFMHFPYNLPNMRRSCEYFPGVFIPPSIEGNLETEVTSIQEFQYVSNSQGFCYSLQIAQDFVLCKHKITGKLFHVGILRTTDTTTLVSAKERLLRWRVSQEMTPFLGKINTALFDGQDLYIILELPHGQTLYEAISSGKFRDNPKAIQYILAQVCLALKSIHQNKLVYGDLCPENISIDSYGHIQLLHYPLAKYCASPENVCVGTIAEYLSPELLQCHRYNVDYSVDTWALGCLAYELFEGSPPFCNEGDAQTYATILLQDEFVRLPYKSNIPEEALELINALLCPDPQKRLGISQNSDISTIQSQRYFEDVEWDEIFERRFKLF